MNNSNYFDCIFARAVDNAIVLEKPLTELLLGIFGYLTAMVNMIVSSKVEDYGYDLDPHNLTTVTKDGQPLRTLSRRLLMLR